ncbi:hypothetical protein LEP1GSC101_1749 [Leptospira borgpetersenii str. UI 09149]|nr:hypothetical protein LEP1GSC101_1749 [Leptospira borgpetersenii str. UI 09149]
MLHHEFRIQFAETKKAKRTTFRKKTYCHQSSKCGTHTFFRNSPNCLEIFF